MNWRRLFNIGVPVQPKLLRGEPRAISAEEETGKGAFITPQSIVTFPVATLAVGLVWKSIGALVPDWAGNLWVPFFLSLAIGVFVYIVAVTEPNSDQTTREKTIGAFVALVNVFYIFASATGIATAITSSGVT
jgi:hypothetical protein